MPDVATVSSTFIDTSDPFYVHPSNNPILLIVPIPFDEMGYGSY